MSPRAIAVTLAALATLGAGRVATTQMTETEKKGAKAIFTDGLSGATFGPTSTGPTSTAPGQPRPTAPKTTAASENATAGVGGLMYYVELVKPSGELVRVNTERVFHSGERIRLHFMSNVDGRIVVVQRKTDGGSRVLFPDNRVNAGDNRIKAGVDTVLPAETAWFRFDENPGAERLLVFLSTEQGYSELRTRVAQPDLDPDKTAELVSAVEGKKGSRDLMLEVEDQATYLVCTNPSSAQSTLGFVSTEIVLNHQP